MDEIIDEANEQHRLAIVADCARRSKQAENGAAAEELGQLRRANDVLRAALEEAHREAKEAREKLQNLTYDVALARARIGFLMPHPFEQLGDVASLAMSAKFHGFCDDHVLTEMRARERLIERLQEHVEQLRCYAYGQQLAKSVPKPNGDTERMWPAAMRRPDFL